MAKLKNHLFFLQIILCLALASLLLYTIIERQNTIIETRLSLYKLEREVKALEEEKRRLDAQIETLKSPKRLLKLLKKPQYSHLRFPTEKNTIYIKKK